MVFGSPPGPYSPFSVGFLFLRNLALNASA